MKIVRHKVATPIAYLEGWREKIASSGLRGPREPGIGIVLNGALLEVHAGLWTYRKLIPWRIEGGDWGRSRWMWNHVIFCTMSPGYFGLCVTWLRCLRIQRWASRWNVTAVLGPMQLMVGQADKSVGGSFRCRTVQ